MAPHFMIKGGLLWLHRVIPPGSTCSTATLQTWIHHDVGFDNRKAR